MAGGGGNVVVFLVHGDVELETEAELLAQVADKAHELGCVLRRGTNDTQAWVMPSEDAAGQLLGYVRGLPGRPWWWRWTLGGDAWMLDGGG